VLFGNSSSTRSCPLGSTTENRSGPVKPVSRLKTSLSSPIVEAWSAGHPGEPTNADAQNLLGYAYRNQRKYDLAFVHYKEALRLDPKHRGANEYIGEAYVLVGDKAKAQEHLAALERICGKGCEEYQDLARAIAQAK